jgi:hypothetical protein
MKIMKEQTTPQAITAIILPKNLVKTRRHVLRKETIFLTLSQLIRMGSKKATNFWLSPEAVLAMEGSQEAVVNFQMKKESSKAIQTRARDQVQHLRTSTVC